MAGPAAYIEIKMGEKALIPESAGRIGAECKMLYSELKCKDVINTRDCKKLGKVCDIEFDPCSGCICKIMVPGCNRILNFLNCEPNIVIPFKNICQIGPDIILVDISC